MEMMSKVLQARTCVSVGFVHVSVLRLACHVCVAELDSTSYRSLSDQIGMMASTACDTSRDVNVLALGTGVVGPLKNRTMRHSYSLMKPMIFARY